MTQAVSTPSNRAKLCDGIVGIINEFGLDGKFDFFMPSPYSNDLPRH
jgi:hypothetical protein